MLPANGGGAATAGTKGAKGRGTKPAAAGRRVELVPWVGLGLGLGLGAWSWCHG